MNKWQLATCTLLVFSISMVIGSNKLSNKIEEYSPCQNGRGAERKGR